MTLKILSHSKILSYDNIGAYTGFLLPVHTINDCFFRDGFEAQQINISALAPMCIKGPHLHLIRMVIFTCLKGNIRIVIKADKKYSNHFSGETYNHLSVEVPSGIPAAIQNIGDEEALILAVWNKAWTPDLKDEYDADFSDYNFNSGILP